MHGSCAKPLKGSETRWINHKIRVMERVIEKFGLYVEHLNSYVATTKNSTVHATVEGKLKKLAGAKVLLRAASFTDVLVEAKRFSLITQEKKINVIKMLNAVESTKSNYERLLKRIKENSELSAISLIVLHTSLKESFLASSNNTTTCLMARTGLTWMSIQTRETAFYSILFVFLTATSGDILATRSPKKMLASDNCHRWWKCLIDTKKWKSWCWLLRMKSLKVFYP